MIELPMPVKVLERHGSENTEDLTRLIGDAWIPPPQRNNYEQIPIKLYLIIDLVLLN